jgi:hypothetical protein
MLNLPSEYIISSLYRVGGPQKGLLKEGPQNGGGGDGKFLNNPSYLYNNISFLEARRIDH